VTERLCHSPRCSPIAAQIAEGLGLQFEQAIPWITFLAALHDLGKAYPHFQFLNAAPSAVRESLQEVGLRVNRHSEVMQHGTVTATALKDAIQDMQPLPDEQTISRLGRVLGGHHGVFPISQVISRARRHMSVAESTNRPGAPSWAGLRRALAASLAEILLCEAEDTPALKDGDNSSPVLLAALVSVADWVGSNEEYFSYLPRCHRTYGARC